MIVFSSVIFHCDMLRSVVFVAMLCCRVMVCSVTLCPDMIGGKGGEIEVERRAPHREIGVRVRVRVVRACGRGEAAWAGERNDSAVARAGQDP